VIFYRAYPLQYTADKSHALTTIMMMGPACRMWDEASRKRSSDEPEKYSHGRRFGRLHRGTATGWEHSPAIQTAGQTVVAMPSRGKASAALVSSCLTCPPKSADRERKHTDAQHPRELNSTAHTGNSVS
jgi:hypothetical protein